jgi:hypothetical protein
MKLQISHGTWRDKPCIRCVAVISKSAKHGIKSRHQKTWMVTCKNPIYSDQELRPIFKANASRWHAKIMAQLFPGIPNKELRQMEIE